MLKSGVSLLALCLILGSFPALAADEKTAPAPEAVTAVPLAPVESTETFDAVVAPTPAPASTDKAAVQASEVKEKAEAPAAEEPQKVEHSRILPVKINPIQKGADEVSKAAPDIEQSDSIDPDSIALYTNQGDGSFGPDLWKGVPRDEIINGINKIPAPKFSPTQRALLQRLLLTKSDVAASSKNSPDLFTARISKLIEMGAFKEAMQLNERLDSPATTEDGALSGMEAFLANGQVAIACLEQKALDTSIKKGNPFWDHLDKFCQTYIKAAGDNGDVSQGLMHASLAFTQSEKTPSPAKFEDLNDRTLVELMALSKSGALDRGKWTVASAAQLNSSVVAFLLAMAPQSVNQKLSLLTVAVAHGIKSPADLDAAYKEIATSPAGASAPRGDWGALVGSNAKFTSTTTVKAALKGAETFSPAAYTPYADELAGLTPAAPLSPADAVFILRILVAAQADLPLTWVNYAYGTDYAEESGESALLDIWNQQQTETKKDDKKAPAQAKPIKGKISPELAYALILKDFLSESTPDKDKKSQSYDNFLSLTGSINYVMPSGELTESLKKASQSGHLGKTLLYGLQVLNGRKAEEIHPSVLQQVLKAFNSAGLSEETVSLAHEALAGLTKEKKEN